MHQSIKDTDCHSLSHQEDQRDLALRRFVVCRPLHDLGAYMSWVSIVSPVAYIESRDNYKRTPERTKVSNQKDEYSKTKFEQVICVIIFITIHRTSSCGSDHLQYTVFLPAV